MENNLAIKCIDLDELSFEKSLFVNNTVDQHVAQKIMAMHVCKLCKKLVIGERHLPHIVYPCGHSFCFTCIAGEKYCPRCNCSIFFKKRNVFGNICGIWDPQI